MLYNVSMDIMQNNYIKTILNPPFDINTVYTIHYFKYGYNFSCELEQHDFWEMIYIDSGKATIISDGREFILTQGQVFFLKPNILHTICTKNEFANSAIISFECLSHAMSHFELSKIYTLTENDKTLLLNILNEAKLNYNERLNDIYLGKLTKNLNAPFGCDQYIKNCLELMLVSLIRRQYSQDDKNYVKKSITTDSIVSSILDFLNANIYDNVTLEDISKNLKFSKTYIKQIFKKEMQTSIIKFFIKMKIDEAKRLISKNEYTITEISNKLGFNSIHYFSRQFKKETDMSPTEYSKSIKADNLI